ncbi:hypothetical protein MTO96_028144 [Rhipicephalus appendiculatus]
MTGEPVGPVVVVDRCRSRSHDDGNCCCWGPPVTAAVTSEREGLPHFCLPFGADSEVDALDSRGKLAQKFPTEDTVQIGPVRELTFFVWKIQ